MQPVWAAAAYEAVLVKHAGTQIAFLVVKDGQTLVVYRVGGMDVAQVGHFARVVVENIIDVPDDILAVGHEP